jgi:hypothetical protein
MRGGWTLSEGIGVSLASARVRIKLSDVLPMEPSPSLQLHPSHQADDIGAIFGVPSSFKVEINATGVPK